MDPATQSFNPFTQQQSQGYLSQVPDEDQEEMNENGDSLSSPPLSPNDPEKSGTHEGSNDGVEIDEGPASPAISESEQLLSPAVVETQDDRVEYDIEQQSQVYDHIPSDNEIEEEEEQAEPDGEQAEPDEEQAEPDEEQAELDEEQAELDEEQAEPDVEQAEPDEEQEIVSRTQQQQQQQRRRVQIMDDSDAEDDEANKEEETSVQKDKKQNFLKQFTTPAVNDASKKRKKQRSDEIDGKRKHQYKRPRHSSDADEEEQHPEEDESEIQNNDKESDVEDVVEDIFGKEATGDEDQEKEEVEQASDEEQEELEADLADLTTEKQDEEENELDQQQAGTYDNEDDEEQDEGFERKKEFVKPNDIDDIDIDVILERKAEKRRGKKRRKNGDVDLSNNNDDQLVAKLIDKMRIATEEDRIFNKSRQPATAKLLLLPVVEQQLYRADLTDTFLESGLLDVMKDWLSPLPDKSLPNIKIRESFIKILQQMGTISAYLLRKSGIGKALMFLYKHPRETQTNKIKLIKIIHDWARPIFHLDTDYKLLSREERQLRDQASQLKKNLTSSRTTKTRNADVDLPFSNDQLQDEEPDADDVACPRARVPRPSTKDYVVRPTSTVDYSDKKDDNKKKTVSRLDEIKRRQQDKKRTSKPLPMIKLSIEGNKMHL